MTTGEDFGDFFERATGRRPYDYQVALAASHASSTLLEVSTGCGKTQALACAWLHQRGQGRAPRRLVYALPMRTLVEQTRDVVLDVRDRLGLDEATLGVHVLMGGEEPGDWRLQPQRDTILVGTIDMLLSRALARGYAESRFAWPVAFGLLNTDCRWVFDEVQLMGPARATSAQLQGLRASLGGRGCETIWASATLDAEALGTVDNVESPTSIVLTDADRAGPLAARLEATKTLERADLTAVAPAQRPARIAAALLERHRRGTRTLCVVNRVDTAIAVQARLLASTRRETDPPRITLVHSRFRPPERARAMLRALASPEPGGAGVIVVATQVVEAGVDLSSALLATETAPFSSIVQRLGRCNRAGELDDARVLWLDTGDPTPKSAQPYEPVDLAAARQALLGLDGASLSPAALEAVQIPETRAATAVLRRRDLVDLFDTTPDLSGLDVDVAPFIREDDDRSVSVCFREIDDVTRRELDGDEQPSPRAEELVQVPLSALDRRRPIWTLDHVDGSWLRRSPHPGATAILAVAGGGYDAEQGWTGNPQDQPIVLTPSSKPLEGVENDPGSHTKAWATLAAHLRDASTEAATLADLLELDSDEAEALVTAAALHDVGKAHPVFQETLLGTAPEADRESRSGELWAKTAGGGGRHSRRSFRHELASALVLANAAPMAIDDPALVRYLVGAHHGRVRMAIRPAPEEERPAGVASDARFALGVADGDVLPTVETPLGTVGPTTLSLACMELGAEPVSWTRDVCALRDRLGPLRLAYLEALVRIADWRASADV